MYLNGRNASLGLYNVVSDSLLQAMSTLLFEITYRVNGNYTNSTRLINEVIK